jgi:hypothetical protein
MMRAEEKEVRSQSKAYIPKQLEEVPVLGQRDGCKFGKHLEHQEDIK